MKRWVLSLFLAVFGSAQIHSQTVTNISITPPKRLVWDAETNSVSYIVKTTFGSSVSTNLTSTNLFALSNVVTAPGNYAFEVAGVNSSGDSGPFASLSAKFVLVPVLIINLRIE